MTYKQFVNKECTKNQPVTQGTIGSQAMTLRPPSPLNPLRMTATPITPAPMTPALMEGQMAAQQTMENMVGHAVLKSNDLIDTAIATMRTAEVDRVMAKKRHILLVTETWLPDVNGVAMSLHQLMRQLVMMGHCVSLISPAPAANALNKLQRPSQKRLTQPLLQPQPQSLSQPKPPQPILPHQHLLASGASNAIASANTNDTISNKANDSNKANSSHHSTTSMAMTTKGGVNDILTHKIEVKGLAIPRYADLQFGLPDYPRIKKALQHIKPDIVHIATEGPLGLAALLAAKRQHIAATTGYHTQFHDFSHHFGLGIIARPMMAYFKWFHNSSKATCVPSLKTQNDLQQLGFKRLYQVGRGVDLEVFNPSHRSEALRRQWGAQEQYTVLTMVSRLSPEKSVDTVIEAFKSLQSTQLHRALKLVIVGDGPDRARLEALAADSGDDIIFTGAKVGQELAQHYASGDAFIFASQVETFGNVVTEAMASGLPVYAFNDAAAGMLVTEQSGALAPVGNKSAFISMVTALPKMQVLKAQGKQARQQVGGFSWQRPAQQILAMFEAVIETANAAKAE